MRIGSFLSTVALASILGIWGCGGSGEPSPGPVVSEEPVASEEPAPSEQKVVSKDTVLDPAVESAPEAEPGRETPAEENREPEPASGPSPVQVSDDVVVPVVAGDGTHKALVTKVLGEIVKERRRSDFRVVTRLGKTTVSWVAGTTRITIVNYPDVAALQEAAESEGSWDGALIVQDPGESYTLHQEALRAAAEAGIRKAVLFINVSDRLTDMEVYDLEAQSLPGWLESFGYEGEGMPVVTAHTDRAAGGDAAEREHFRELLETIEGHLAGVG